MQQIDDLKQEIQSFEAEIAKLQQELTVVGGFTMQLATSNAPSEIAKSIRADAQQVLERQPAIKGLRDAIAELTSRLNQKQSQLQELEVVKLKKHRQDRIIEGQSRLRAKFSDVEAVAQSLQNLYFDLKAIALEYEPDFAQIHPPTPGGIALNRNSLLNIEPLTIPHFAEEKDRFVLSNKFFDLFSAERELLQKQREEAGRRSKQNHEDMLAQIKQRELDKQRAIEEKERQLLLPIKRSQLAEYKDARRNTLAGLKTANVSDFDDAIASLEVEIESLQKPVQT